MKPKVIDRVNVLDELIKTTKIVQNLNEIVNDGDCQSFTVTSENRPSFMFDGICTFHKYFGANSGHQFAQGWNQGGGLGECVCGIRYLTNGTWSAWQQIATTQQINDLSSNSLQAKSTSAFGKDFNNVNIIGMYHVIDVQSWSNKPPTVENVGNIIVMGGTNNNSLSKVQYFIPHNNTGIYIRTRGYGLSEWMGWQQIATTTKTEIDIPYSSAYVAYGNSYVSKISKCNNHVSVVAVFRTSSGQAVNGISTIANIPVGFRPSLHHSFNGGVLVPNGIELRNNGDLMVNMPNASTYAISFEYYI